MIIGCYRAFTDNQGQVETVRLIAHGEQHKRTFAPSHRAMFNPADGDAGTVATPSRAQITPSRAAWTD